ncbi:hypothetical protein GGU10DRAFT_417052 [Lentinula aff. detonsa]|uniref:AMP-dependent synthetase/ligase domain-containing protein n=1 Tax=Lentinula aff. detonsa TaxID=2804958 RepID=A0AA38KBL2_9AGAR|nr:hypothetical protein GGU10DRAFT_417052 [Lentinula aff. detonsa]
MARVFLNVRANVSSLRRVDSFETRRLVLANTPSIKFFIYDGEPSGTLVSGIDAVRESIKVVSLDELRALPKSQPTEPLKARLPKPETMACIMYTSGSTGPPKVVCIPHANPVAFVGAVYMLLGHHLTYDGIYLAYLPLYIVELIMLFVSMTPGYGRVQHCAQKCSGSDRREATGYIVWWCCPQSRNTKILGHRIGDGFAGVRNDRILWNVAILPPELMRYGSVSLPVPSIETKLLDLKDAGYLSTNKQPQGEVCIRGPSVTKGYYKRPDLNDDETIFTKDGWFRTGDVGQWNEDGTLSLIDRVKNLVKLQGGEYLALERPESTYKACNYVGNICIYLNRLINASNVYL